MSDHDKAMELIRDEMAKSHDNPGLCILGEYLTERLRVEPGIAAAILKKKEPLAFGFAAIRDHARKISRGGFACVDDKTGFTVACKALGIDAPEITSSGRADDIRPYKEERKETQAIARDALDLDALLGGI